MIVAVQASGRIVMLIGARVLMPPASRWWSMISITSACSRLAGSSAGLLVSTITQTSSAVTSSMMRGLDRFQRSSIHNASVFGSPCSTASAGVLRHSFRYQAQMMGEPVESVSGEVWPKTLIMMRLEGCWVWMAAL